MNKNKEVANLVAQTKVNVKQGFGVVDNPPELVAKDAVSYSDIHFVPNSDFHCGIKIAVHS